MADQDYQSAMREAASAAWDQSWDQAIQLYQRAAQLMPNDPQAVAGLALSLMESGRIHDALQMYQRVAVMVPNDPLPQEKMADILETLNRPGDAAKRYLSVAELYFARKDMNNAVRNWERAAALDPDLPQPHMRLGVYYEQGKQNQFAIFEYLALARVLQQANQNPKAEQALVHAMQLDPLNMDARSALDDFRKGVPLQRVESPTRPAIKTAPEPPRQPELEALESDEEISRTPVDDAARYAMGLLADLVWSGDVPQAGLEPLVKAIDLHQIGAADEAIEQYTAALKAGLNHPALNFNLGLLHIYSGQIEQSIPLLNTATTSPEYGAAANLMLGQGYYARKDLPKAAEHLVEALHLADAQLNNECDSGGYVRLVSSLSEQPPEYLNDLCRVLIQYLDDNRWKEKLRDTLTGYAAQGKSSYVPDLVELVMEGGRPGMAAIMERIDTYLARNMVRMALEEIHYAIEKSPDYLPAHRRLADILSKEGKTQEAAEKINLVANVYLVRGNPDKAADLFAEVIQLWPADIGARQKVIDMLKSQGRVNDVVKQYAEMGDFYAKLMADIPRATEIYAEALDYAKKNNAEAPGLVSILKALADIESQQLNWRKALDYYQQVNNLAPDDQEAALATIDLNFQMGQSDQAVAALDNYIRYCITRGDAEKAVRTLEEQTRRYPNEVAVRQRLADVYRQQKRIPDAIAQMDAIGELLLDAGRVDEAAAVISKIVEMNPPDIEGYKQLLDQLKSPGA